MQEPDQILNFEFLDESVVVYPHFVRGNNSASLTSQRVKMFGFGSQLAQVYALK